jgi:hypothetical protein
MASEIPEDQGKRSEGTNTPSDKDTDHSDADVLPPSDLAKSQPPPAQPGNKPSDEKGRDWLDYTKFTIEILGVGVLITYTIFAGIQACRTSDTLREIQQQTPKIAESADAAKQSADRSKEANTIARESLESVQRAYLTFPPSPQMIVLNLPSGPVVTFEMPVENSGNTEAHRVRDRVSCVTPLGALPNSFNFPDRSTKYCGNPWMATGASVIPAKGNLFSQKVQVDIKIVNEFIQQNQGPFQGRLGLPSHPTRTITFYGWVTYRDIFKTTPDHLSEFCRELVLLRIAQKSADSEWGYCPTHNCTDEDCPDYENRVRAAKMEPTYRRPLWPQKP